MLKRFIEINKNESGYVLIWALVLLVLGGILIAPLLSLMGTGLDTSHFREEKTREFYAVEAGIEDAASRIRGDYSAEDFELPMPEFRLGADGLPEPVAVLSEEIPRATPETMACLVGPCRHYADMVIESQDKGPGREMLRHCIRFSEAGEEFGMERLERLLVEERLGGGLDEILTRVEKAAREYRGKVEAADDATMVLVNIDNRLGSDGPVGPAVA